MRTFRCTCAGTLFFDNSACLACGKETGFCPACRNIVALLPMEKDRYGCGNAACGATLLKCVNYREHDVCNRCVVAARADEPALCDCCSLTRTIPDLDVSGHLQKWYRLECAKRRLLYELDLLGLPYRFDPSDPRPKLSFHFKANIEPKRFLWWSMGKKEQVFTGHANGCITINIREVNDGERERLRVTFGEKHRTLIGHFRHEIAHYYWEVLVRGRDEERCVEVFGNHESPSYQESLDRYYKEGPQADWRRSYVSAYSTMHPWEDFAETFATYLDMISVLHTAQNAEFVHVLPHFGDFDDMMLQYKALGIGMNEINRSMGLLDLVPEVFVAPVRAKMRYVHELIAAAK